MSEKLLTARDIAKELNLKIATVYAAAADGRLPYVRLWEGQRRPLIRFRREDIEKLIEDRTFPPKNDDTH